MKILAVCVMLLFGLQPMYSQFGKNKVQYQKFEWKYISSEHFDVYYSNGLNYVAQFCAYKAEDALASLYNNFGYRITKKINLVVYGSHNEFQQTNVLSEFMPEGVGGVTELFKNRVVIPFEGDWEKFRHVIHHELVHAYLNEVFYSGSMQVAIQSKTQIPLWMNEGLAEYESIGGLDIATDMFMRDITISEYLPPLSRLGGYFAYRGGQAFYSYVASKYGKGKVGELINRLRSLGNADAAFKSAFGMSLEDFSEEWENEIKKQYLPDLDKFKRLDEFAKRLTNHAKENNFYNTSPAISPDGSKVAFISDRDGDFGIYVMDVDRKSEPRLIVSSQRSLDFEELNILTPGISWNPKGDKLAITAKAGGEDALYIIDIQKDETEKFTFDIKTMTSARWSPDGKYIAVVATVTEQPDIYLFDVQTKNLNKLTNDVFTDLHPAWSNDSKYVYFVSDRLNYLNGVYNKTTMRMWEHNINSSDIYRINIANKEIERITTDPQNKKTSLVVSKDNAKLFFVTEYNGIGNLYEMNLETKAIRPKTNSISGITQLDLSKDETKLLFSAQNKGGFDLFMIRNPFDKNLENEELPLTKYKIKLRDQEKLANQITTDTVTITQSKDEIKGYGKFAVEFSRQQMVTPNKDIPVYKAETTTKDKTSSTEFLERDYKVTLSNDIILGNAGYNNFWGSYQGIIQMLFSDLLGDHQIYTQLNLFNDLNNSGIMVQYGYMPEVIDYYITAQHNALLWYLPNYNVGAYNLYRLRNYGLKLDASYAFSRFDRMELGVQWLGVAKENQDIPTEESYGAHYILPSARYVYDNTQFGFLAPYRGMRAFVDMQLSPVTRKFVTFTTDVRQYVPIYRQIYGFMARFSGGASLGADPRNFFMGGVDNWINRGAIAYTSTTDPQLFQNPEDFAFMNLPMPVRGFEISQSIGSKYFLTNLEFRFPLFQALVAGPLPIMLDGVMGSFFLDLGTSWSSSDLGVIGFRSPQYITLVDNVGNTSQRRRYTEGTILMSTGIGMRTVFLGYPVRVDVAWRKDGDTWSEPNWLFSLGLDL
ncbi:MAG: peptidase MA family metallohydrolase [Candidatus Kapaibacterium sp.]|nr:hypothetical protein [Bacteroidota bacterium]